MQAGRVVNMTIAPAVGSRDLHSSADSQSSGLLSDIVLNSRSLLSNNEIGTFEVTDPATGEVIAELPDVNEKQCLRAINTAVLAQDELSSLTGKERGYHLRQWHNLIVDHADELATIIAAENGKPITEAKGEVAYAASFVDWFAGAAPRIEGSVRILIDISADSLRAKLTRIRFSHRQVDKIASSLSSSPSEYAA